MDKYEDEPVSHMNACKVIQQHVQREAIIRIAIRGSGERYPVFQRLHANVGRTV